MYKYIAGGGHLVGGKKNGHKAVMKLLQPMNGVDPDSKDIISQNQTLLLWAAAKTTSNHTPKVKQDA